MKRRVILAVFAVAALALGGCASHQCPCLKKKQKTSDEPVAVGATGGATTTSTNTGGGATYHYPARRK
jgi:hypothetical protein